MRLNIAAPMSDWDIVRRQTQWCWGHWTVPQSLSGAAKLDLNNLTEDIVGIGWPNPANYY